MDLKIKKEAFDFIKQIYNSTDRHYHTYTHIERMFDYVKDDKRLTREVVYAILFHDIVYQAGNERNELLSAKFFWFMYSVHEIEEMLDIAKVMYLIQGTEHPVFGKNPESDLFIEADFFILHKDSKEDLLEYEKQIRKEFSRYSDEEYKKERIKFLSKLKGELSNEYEDKINQLIDYLS